MDMHKLESLLIKHEQYKRKPYLDTLGNLTVGIGRKMDSVGISYEEAIYLLHNDIKAALNHIHKNHRLQRIFDALNDDRQIVIINMIFNLGYSKFMQFKKMLEALEKNDYALAAQEMLDSRWKSQVKRRAIELAKVMRGDQSIDVML